MQIQSNWDRILASEKNLFHLISKDGVREPGFGYYPKNMIRLNLPFMDLLQSLIGTCTRTPVKKVGGMI